MLQIKEDNEDLIHTFSDHDIDGLESSRDRIVRRRSSKACDQCRRSKSKCMRVSDQPCQSCALLGVECTFLGPSRKRGPAKGYLTDLELKLHQMEALLGVLLASNDPRATSLINAMSKDSVARDVLARVDTSPVGTQPLHTQELYNPRGGSSSVGRRIASELTDSTREWQRHLLQIMQNSMDPGSVTGGTAAASSLEGWGTSQTPHTQTQTHLPSSFPQNSSPGSFSGPHAPKPVRPPVTLDLRRSNSRSCSPNRRRRFDPLTPLTAGSPGMATGGSSGNPSDGKRDAPSVTYSGRATPDDSDSEDLHDTMGQLSLDDASQIRYHGKASGLHLLGQTERIDRRAENGIWHFPPARVWPPTERPIEKARALFASDFGVQLPTRDQQRMLLDLYFTYVNPSLPLFDRASFMKAWTFGVEESSEAPPDHTFIPSRLPTPLMLVIFSIAIRLSADGSAGPSEGTMSTSGDEYLSAAKYMMTANPYAASRPATCQAYLLIAYREIGIGAMSQAWLFLGVAVRMAQDLGLHRSVDKFHAVAANLFAPAEKECRNRVWGCCVVMDRYASTYMGRPCMIAERDYDTPLPSEVGGEASEMWTPHSSPPRGAGGQEGPNRVYSPIASHAIACFSASTRLSSILGQIVENLYPVRQVVHSRHAEAARLEEQLEAFYLDLPPYLKYDVSNPAMPIPPPHVITLHMQYWNAVLLVHRPFIQRLFNPRRESPEAMGSPADSETLRASSARALELCKVAAGQVSNLAQIYQKSFCLLRSAPFLVYYIFSAAIMHVVVLNHYPDEAAAAESTHHLQQCMDTLKGIANLWPAAGRGWELINGCRTEIRRPPVATLNVNRAHFARTNTNPNIVDNNMRDNTHPIQFPAHRILSHSRSLSHVRGDHREQLAPSPLSDQYGPFHRGGQVYQNPVFQQQAPPPTSFTRPYTLQPTPANPPLAGWGNVGDANFVRPTYSSNTDTNPSASASHSRSASVGSHRDQVNVNPGPVQGMGAPMPHFWSDPFTDSTLLSSNYYGLPSVDRQTQIAIDHNLHGGFGQVDFAPFGGTNF